MFAARRGDLSACALPGDWVNEITGRDCQLSPGTYQDFFEEAGGILGEKLCKLCWHCPRTKQRLTR
jgi:hypothetical protein